MILISARPSLLVQLAEPAYEWVQVTEEGSWQLYDPFDVLTAEEGEARAVEVFQRRWPGVVVDQSALPRLRQAAAVATRDEDAALHEGQMLLAMVPQPFSGGPSRPQLGVFVAREFDGLFDQVVADVPCARIGVGYAQGQATTGMHVHALALFCEQDPPR
ncbi:MAG: hypothetical protein H6740_13620 [Alphaproteobacteria bacterium]|nr:hypothetical protein [Alphaproteobacteria bacterium]